MKKYLVLVPLLLSLTLKAQVVNTLDYFAGSPGVCTSTDPTNTGTFDSQLLDTTSCPGKQIVVHTIGGATPWVLEVFVVTPEFIRVTSHGGFSFDYEGWKQRVFYIDKRNIGIEWILSSFSAHPEPDTDIYGISWNVSNYADPWYSNGLACQDDPNPPLQPNDAHQFHAWINYSHYPKFLYDVRNGTIVGPYDIEVVQTNSIMGNTIERYLYGRWIDPLDGVEKGLGLIGFEVDQVAVEWNPTSEMISRSFSLNRYLVNCKTNPPCFRCPDINDKHKFVPHHNPIFHPIETDYNK